MGITFVQKSDLTQKKFEAKTALVLAGGAITGGTFKVGGLKAMNDFLINKKVTDFDLYLGLSAGSFLAAALAGGISPEEMLKSMDGSSKYFTQLAPLDLYWPNFKELWERPLKFAYQQLAYIPGIAWDIFSALPSLKGDVTKKFMLFFNKPTYANFEALVQPIAKIIYPSRSLPSWMNLIPSGFFDNRALERFLRDNMRRNHLSNSFKILNKTRGKSLYISAMNLDTGERVTFGHDEKNDLTISQAVQASSALPCFYKPARLKGVDYVDGGVHNTASLDIAIQKGADLIICYNPFRPLNNKVFLEYIREENKFVTRNRRISSNGMLMVLNQVFRTLLHTRLHHEVKSASENKNFKGDIILIEPSEDDVTYFELNPLLFWNRASAARQGFESVRKSIDSRFDQISKILASYGIEMTRELAELDHNKISKPTSDESTIMNVLEKETPKRRLRLVSNKK